MPSCGKPRPLANPSTTTPPSPPELRITCASRCGRSRTSSPEPHRLPSPSAVIELLPHEAPPPPLEPEPQAEETDAIPEPGPAPEVKQVSRAEDVARRAQEFLRRVAGPHPRPARP